MNNFNKMQNWIGGAIERGSKLEVKFWFDQTEQAIVVIHCPSGERREIKKTKKIDKFLQVYGVGLEECKGVKEDLDRMHLFKMIRIQDSIKNVVLKRMKNKSV